MARGPMPRPQPTGKCAGCGRTMSKVSLYAAAEPIEVDGDTPPRRPPRYCRACLPNG